MKKIGVLGAYGSVGRNALEYLYNTGKYELYAVGRDLSKVENDSFFKAIPNIAWTSADVTDTVQLESFIAEKDVVLNTVSCSSMYSLKIAEICLKNGKRYVDAGMSEGFEKFEGERASFIYGAGALPGLSEVLGVYAADNFKTVTEYTHITSMEGVFSYGAAFDYLKGISADIAKGSTRSLERTESIQLPFIGTADIRCYVDGETKYVTEKVGCSNGRHYLAFGSGKMKSVIENAALTFSNDPENTAKQLVDFSRMYNIKAKEHIALIIEVKGEAEDGTNKIQTMILKCSSSPALTGMSAGLCVELAADAKYETGVFPLSKLPDSVLYDDFIPHIVYALKNSENTSIFETYPVGINELNEESFGEI